MLGDSLYVVWPQGGDEVVALLAADRVPGIPRHPDTLADLLIERGYALPTSEGDGVRRYWRLAPAPLARDGKPVTLTLLRLTSPHHVLSGPAPAPVGLAGDAVVRAAVSRPVLVDSTVDADDAARRDEAARLGLAWEDGDDEGMGPRDVVDRMDVTDPRACAAVPESPSPSVTDPRRSAEVPATPNSTGRAPSPIEQAAARLRQQPPVPTSAVAPSTPAEPTPAPADPRTVAEAWFQARRPGAGARLLLALAAAIRTGERSPATVLYCPDQPGNPLWVRVPEGLEGRGPALEAQIAALWDDALVAVDILKPYLRLRTIDAIRGVALNVEASGYFAALLPAGALDRCTPRTRDGTVQGTTDPPPALTGPAQGPHAPTPTLTSPDSTPAPTAGQSPSAVATALINRVRAAHAATTAGSVGPGAVVVMTPADIAAAAHDAGLKLPSLKLALMHRPGCRMTPDGGAQVTAA